MAIGPPHAANITPGLVAGSDIDVVRAVFSAFAERDLERVLAMVDPEMVFHTVTGSYVGHDRPYRGHDGLRRYFRDVGRAWDELTLTPSEFREVGEVILVTGRVDARSPARVVSGSAGWIWRVRDGRAVYCRAYPSASAALADAGVD